MGSPPVDPLLEAIGARVRERREARALTRRGLAEATGLSERFLAQVESGQGNIAVTRLATLAQALGTTVSELAAEPPPRRDERRVLALLGLRGSGKSALGRALAERRSLEFLELDRRVEELAGIGLGDLFAIHGDAYYRRLAAQTLDRLLIDGERGLVLEVGGGVVLDGGAFDLLLRHTHTVWLRATPDDHWNRVLAQGDSRPMGTRPDARTELAEILARREPLYARAEHHVDTSELGFEGSLARLEELARALL